MASSQQGTYAVFFGLPGLSAVKVGTTSSPAAITAEIVSISGNSTADTEETRDADGEIVHVTTYNQRRTVEIEGFFRSDTSTPTISEAVSAQDMLAISSQVQLVGVNGGSKNFDDLAAYNAGNGNAYRLASFTWTSTNSAKATFRATLETLPGISSLTWLT